MINGSIISLGYALCANHKYNKNKGNYNFDTDTSVADFKNKLQIVLKLIIRKNSQYDAS
jgi:hypothetical protein